MVIETTAERTAELQRCCCGVRLGVTGLGKASGLDDIAKEMCKTAERVPQDSEQRDRWTERWAAIQEVSINIRAGRRAKLKPTQQLGALCLWNP